MGNRYIELPSFDMFAGLFVRDDYDELRDFTANHPFVKLGHNLLEVRFDLVVGRDWEEPSGQRRRTISNIYTKHVEAILLDASLESGPVMRIGFRGNLRVEILCRIHSSLESTMS